MSEGIQDAVEALVVGDGDLHVARGQLALAAHERSLLASALRHLVDTLPTCTALVVDKPGEAFVCPNPATKAWRRGESRFCDAHAPRDCPDYPRAPSLRAVIALLAGLR